jgi:hypothetical protein
VEFYATFLFCSMRLTIPSFLGDWRLYELIYKVPCHWSQQIPDTWSFYSRLVKCIFELLYLHVPKTGWEGSRWSTPAPCLEADASPSLISTECSVLGAGTQECVLGHNLLYGVQVVLLLGVLPRPIPLGGSPDSVIPRILVDFCSLLLRVLVS